MSPNAPCNWKKDDEPEIRFVVLGLSVGGVSQFLAPAQGPPADPRVSNEGSGWPAGAYAALAAAGELTVLAVVWYARRRLS